MFLTWCDVSEEEKREKKVKFTFSSSMGMSSASLSFKVGANLKAVVENRAEGKPVLGIERACKRKIRI
jgi:hypothetical protein